LSVATLAALTALLFAACGAPRAGGPPLPPPPHPAIRGEALAGIVRSGVLRVGSDLSDPPLSFREGTTPRGFEIDLATLLAAAMGVRLQVTDMPRAQMHSGFADADLLISALQPAGAPGPVSAPYYRMSQAILSRGQAVLPSDGSLRGVRVAAQAGSAGEEIALRLGASPALVYLPMAALDAVSRGQAQAAVADAPLVLEYARNHPQLRVAAGRWGSIPLVVAARADAPDLLAFTSAAIRELEQTGGLAQLRERWRL
jgi:polar amino acid transport system substrate-binding protein